MIAQLHETSRHALDFFYIPVIFASEFEYFVKVTVVSYRNNK